MNNLSRRDYFAAMAMQGMLTSLGMADDDRIPEQSISKLSGQYADALIAELDQDKEIPKTESYGIRDPYCLVCQGTGFDSTGFYKCRKCNRVKT